MICPKCGKELNSKYRYCPNCLLKSLGAEDTDIKNDFTNNRHVHVPKNNIRKNNKKKFNIDSSNVNGYVVEEGMSIKGGKLRKGSDTSRHAQYRRWRYGY